MRRASHRKTASLDMWERVKSGEWQYGRGLALAWNGESGPASTQFEAAAEKFRLRGEEEMMARVVLHREILGIRVDPDAERRHRRAMRIATRLQGLAHVEDYRPPFAVVPGPRLAEGLWRDLASGEFLLEGEADEDASRDEMTG